MQKRHRTKSKKESFFFILRGVDPTQKLPLIRGKELGYFLNLLDEMISSVVNKQKGEDGGGLVVTGVYPGSICVECLKSSTSSAAFTTITNGIASGRCSLPYLHNSIKQIRKFAAAHKARLEFKNQRYSSAVATIEPFPDKTEESQCLTFNTQTTLFGRIAGIGGLSRVRVKLSLIGYPGDIDFVVDKKQDIQEFLHRYGKIVGVNGNAKIIFPKRKIIEFTFSSISSYEEAPIMHAVDTMRQNFGAFFDKIDDIDKEISALRG